MTILKQILRTFFLAVPLAHVVPVYAQTPVTDSRGRQGFILDTNYSAHVGRVTSVADLGIGNYQQQLTRIEKAQKAGTPLVLNPNDGIKRQTDKTIYGGADNRIEVYEIPSAAAKSKAAGVASISEMGEMSFPSRGFCNVFLVAKDLAMTASHCVNFRDYSLNRVRFNDQHVAAGLLGVVDPYEIAQVIVWDHQHDFALIRLRAGSDGKLPGEKYTPLILRSVKLPRGAPLYMIGHSGRDTKRMGNCTVITDVYNHPTTGKYTFGCDCTAFGGNSGSPVFDAATNTVVGVFWGGQPDSRAIKSASEKEHEFVSPIWRIAQDIPNFDWGKWPDGVSFLSGALRWHTRTFDVLPGSPPLRR